VYELGRPEVNAARAGDGCVNGGASDIYCLRLAPGVIFRLKIKEENDMSESNSNNPFGFDWQSLEKMLADRLPFPLPDMAKVNHRDASWVSDYVNQLLKTSRVADPSADPIRTVTGLNADIYETHTSVICRIRVPADADIYSIRVWVHSRHLKLEGLPGKRHTQTIALPASVNSKSCSAIFKKDVLEIKMAKDRRKPIYREVYVQFGR
jgi:HSP20 family molecular chaperone IbpA